MQGRPVRALCDAYMHHGQTRGNEKHIEYVQNTQILREQAGHLEKYGGERLTPLIKIVYSTR